MFITKSYYKRIKHFYLGEWKREYYHPRLSRSEPLSLRVSGSVYREDGLRGQDTAKNIRISVQFIKDEIIVEHLLKRQAKGLDK